MKLVVRADDFGFTKSINDGIMKSVSDGVVTAVDLMLDTPGVEDAIARIREYPWISVGWHTHFYWKPVLAPELVPSLVDMSTGRFKPKNVLYAEGKYDEALIEFRAEIEKCIRLLGKAPDTTDLYLLNNEFLQARRCVCDEYGIAYGFAEKFTKEKHIATEKRELKATGVLEPLEKYKELDIYAPNDLNSLKYIHQDSAAELRHYDPVQYYIDDPDKLAEHKISVQAWHPGYVDEFVTEMYYNPLLNAARPMDVAALCSDRLKKWVRDNNVELVNFRDALYGTNEYQNHLKAIGSDLAIHR